MEEFQFLWIFSGVTKKNNLSSNNSCLSRDSKLVLSEYKSELLLDEPAPSGLQNELL